METTVYHERQTLQYRVLIAIGILALLLVSSRLGKAPVESTVWLLALGLLIAAALWTLTTFTVTVTASDLQFGFPFYRKRVSLDRVRVGEIQRISWAAGAGIHYWSGVWVYNGHFGRGVSIQIGTTRYLLGSDQPERLQAVLLERIGSRARMTKS
jgi:hypothetical protein